MLDLQKYLRRAEADPGFKAKLLQDANQAIKDEFGEDLPYKLKCKEKLSFEIEPIEDWSDAEASSVAGGNPPNAGRNSTNARVGRLRHSPIYDLMGYCLPAVCYGQFLADACDAIGDKKRLRLAQNKAKRFTDGMGLNSTGR